MTIRRTPISAISRAALYVVAGGTLAAALVLLLAPIWFTSGYYVPRSWMLPFEALRLICPLGVVWYVRRRVPIPATDESPAARMAAFCGLCISTAGILWMSHDVERELSWGPPGLRDLPWHCLLAASESMRVAVHRHSRALGLVALAALAGGLCLVEVLGTVAMDVSIFYRGVLGTLGRGYTFVVARPWVPMLWLAGLWAWVAAQDRLRSPTQATATSGHESAGTT